MPRAHSNQKLLGVTEFGRQLIQTEDLDPVYSMLWKAKLPTEQLKSWLLSYWCFYSCGTACRIAESSNYWQTMHQAAASSAYRRGSERRHFRGAFAVTAVSKLKQLGISNIFTMLLKDNPVSLFVMLKKAKSLYGFGDWIAFKIADMLERLQLCQVEFSQADTFLFDSPRQGAKLVTQRYTKIQIQEQEEPVWAFKYLTTTLGKQLAPPDFSRTINGQEIETILCKWKSHLAGHYPIGHDINEIHKDLVASNTNLGTNLLQFLPCRV